MAGASAKAPVPAPSPPPRGLLIDILTPLTPDGALDEEGLDRLLHLARPQAHALVLAGPQAGQGHLLERAAWEAVVEAGLAALEPGAPVVVGVTGSSSRETLARARHLAELLGDRPAWGLDLALYHHSNRGLPDWVGYLGRALRRPVILANHPHLIKGRKGATRRINLIPAVVAKASRLPELAGVVAAGGLDHGLELGRALRGGPARLYDGAEASFLAHPASAGVVSPGAQLLPGPWRGVVDSSLGEADLGPGERSRLLEEARAVEGLARVLAPAPGPLAAAAAAAAGLIASETCLHAPPAAPALAEARAWGRAFAGLP